MFACWEPFGDVRRRGDVFHEMTGMQQEMNRVFDEFFGDRRNEAAEGNWSPALDVSETEAVILVRVELPGMSRDDIEINLHENILTITGEKKKEAAANEQFHRLERSYGKFNRTLTLPVKVNSAGIQAHFTNGILQISLPKIEDPKPQKITIRTA